MPNHNSHNQSKNRLKQTKIKKVKEGEREEREETEETEETEIDKAKNMGNNIQKATSTLFIHQNNGFIPIGTILFTQKHNGVQIEGIVNHNSIQDGLHGFHVHEYGDMSQGCHSMGPHFDSQISPSDHGDIEGFGHWGDFGNVLAKNHSIEINLFSKRISLKQNHKNSIIGRGLVLHKDQDDLGRGNNEESKKTGNSGERIACGIIAISK